MEFISEIRSRNGWGGGECGCAAGLVITMVRCLRQHDNDLLDRTGDVIATVKIILNWA